MLKGGGRGWGVGRFRCHYIYIGNHLPNLYQFNKNGNLKGGIRKFIEIFEGGGVAKNHPTV